MLISRKIQMKYVSPTDFQRGVHICHLQCLPTSLTWTKYVIHENMNGALFLEDSVHTTYMNSLFKHQTVIQNSYYSLGFGVPKTCPLSPTELNDAAMCIAGKCISHTALSCASVKSSTNIATMGNSKPHLPLNENLKHYNTPTVT